MLGFHLEMPASAEALLDEAAFERDEFMPYWAELWPSGLALARAVADVGVSGRVLEVGCGLGLPALVAARGGADVLSTDWAEDAIALLRRNAAANEVALEARVWDWRSDPAELGAPFDLVLAADVLYETRNHEPLLRVLPELVAPDGQLWLADPGRAIAAPFAGALEGVMTPLAAPAEGVTAWGGGRRPRH